MDEKYIPLSAALCVAAAWCPDDDGSVGKTGDLREMLDELEALEPADVRPVEWIPVTERLPPEDEEEYDRARWSEKVIFWHMGCGQRIGWYSHAFNIWSVSGNILTIRADFVTHWMPLPEPPEREVEA